MTKKIDASQQLTRKIGLRVSEPFYQKMKGWLATSNCGTVAELARRMLYQEKIIWYHKDTNLEPLAIELTAIRKELRSIGTNVNQVTRHFHSTNLPSQKLFDALKILDEYKKVDGKVDALLTLVDKLYAEWSQK